MFLMKGLFSDHEVRVPGFDSNIDPNLISSTAEHAIASIGRLRTNLTIIYFSKL